MNKGFHAPHYGSFRDPAGFVFEQDSVLYRQVNKAGQADYDSFMQSGLYEQLVGEGLIVRHEEVADTAGFKPDGRRYKIIRPERVPFISYPYEWSFSQLKDAALLTLRLQKLALAQGMILKDASAFNVQFVGIKPIFIDTLSFKTYEAGRPWEAYKQFCEHFVTTLTLASYGTPDSIKTLRVFLDGIPLSVAAAWLPKRAKRRWGTLSHIYLHAASQRRYDNNAAKSAAKPRRVSAMALNGLLSSLENTVQKLDTPKKDTEWGDYYNDTNYTDSAFKAKKKIVAQLLADIKPLPKTVWDLGANDGTFSELSAAAGAYTVAFDIDPNAVNRNYLNSRGVEIDTRLLPLSQDLANPSPSLGWAHTERLSLQSRGPADAAIALALVHHLAIGNTLPFGSIADFFAKISKYLIVEFVPREDSKVQLLLRRRVQKFPEYTIENFEDAFERKFILVKRSPIPGSHRVIYLYKAKTLNNGKTTAKR
ncbi:MAG: hypothetical protein WD887_03130 [Candidatus Saccharimonadales bacterium]